MATGITFTKDYKGIPSKVTIDLKKYGDQLMDFFRSVGVEEKANRYQKPNARLKRNIAESKKTKNIIKCENAEDMFNKLGI